MDAGGAGLVNIRGWLEGDARSIDAARETIGDALDKDWHNIMWAIPRKDVSGHGYAFYGSYVHPDAVEWFLQQLRGLAALALPGVDEPVRGLFLVSDRHGNVTQWQVSDRQVRIVPGGPQHAYLG